MNKITLTKEQVIEFINNQPDDKEVNFDEATATDKTCGCLMVHIFRSYFNNYDTINCSTKAANDWDNNNHVEMPNMRVSLEPFVGKQTYKDVKQNIDKLFY